MQQQLRKEIKRGENTTNLGHNNTVGQLLRALQHQPEVVLVQIRVDRVDSIHDLRVAKVECLEGLDNGGAGALLMSHPQLKLVADHFNS